MSYKQCGILHDKQNVETCSLTEYSFEIKLMKSFVSVEISFNLKKRRK